MGGGYVKYDDNLDEAIVVDIDGTIAQFNPDSPRSPYDYSRLHEDILDDAVATTVAMYYRHGYRVILLTGRPDDYRSETEKWLAENRVDYDQLIMRKSGDKRRDTVIKQEEIEGLNYNIKIVFEDRPRNVRMFQGLGYKVFNVGQIDVEF